MSLWKYLCFGFAVTVISGCASVRPDIAPVPSHALTHPESTPLGRALAPAEQDHPGQSGFHLLAYGLEALVARMALADSAERSIDAQYYIYDEDEAGSLLTAHLLRAADRGVRVRLLVDDFNVRDERQLAALCAHPGIQVRIFNPMRWRPGWTRVPAYLLNFRRADHRMHNKLFVADNAIAILGGRNIADGYFNLGTDPAFRDFDLLAAGAVPREASAAFDQFWNSAWAVPVPTLAGRAPTAADLAWLRKWIAARLTRASPFAKQYAATRDSYLTDLESGRSLIWADGEVVSEPPQKIDGSSPATDLVSARLDREWRRASREVLIEAAYFVPGNTGVETFRKLHERGVAVRLLTSSLEATDVPIAYCAYRSCRRALLEAGVELFEFKLHSAPPGTAAKWYRHQPPYSTLHSKVIVFDRQRVWIGSLNLDPRSEKLNTEIGVIVDSRELADQVANAIAGDMTPAKSWRVRLEPAAGGSGTGSMAGARVTWTGERNGRPVTLHHEPAGWRARVGAFFWSLIPGIEGEL